MIDRALAADPCWVDVMTLTVAPRPPQLYTRDSRYIIYEFLGVAKKRDFASFQHHGQVFRQATVEAADNQVLLPQRTSRYENEKSSRFYRSAYLLDGILVFGAGSGPDPSASCCTDS